MNTRKRCAVRMKAGESLEKAKRKTPGRQAKAEKKWAKAEKKRTAMLLEIENIQIRPYGCPHCGYVNSFPLKEEEWRDVTAFNCWSCKCRIRPLGFTHIDSEDDLTEELLERREEFKLGMLC